MSDSQAALKALGSTEVNSGLVLNCIQELNVLGSRNNVKLVWCPGHTNILGNEEADRLAKIGSETPFFGPEPAVGISYGIAKRCLNDLLTHEHNAHWKKVAGQAHSKAILTYVSKEKTDEMLRMGRADIRAVTGLITGHCWLNKHFYTIGLSETDTCRGCGEEEETPLHALCQCEGFTTFRRRLLGMEKTNQEELRKIPLKKILEFFKNTGLL